MWLKGSTLFQYGDINAKELAQDGSPTVVSTSALMGMCSSGVWARRWSAMKNRSLGCPSARPSCCHLSRTSSSRTLRLSYLLQSLDGLFYERMVLFNAPPPGVIFWTSLS